jgi:hypothetical protein
MSNEQENPSENQPIQPNDDSLQPVANGTTTPPPFQQLPPIGQFGGGMGQQNLPNSTIALILGIISIPGCCCYGVLGLILGIIAWVLGGGDVKKYKLNPNQYSISSYKNANAGKICGLIGAILGALYLIMIIAFIAFFGFAALKDPELMKEMLRSKGLQ